MSSPIPRPSYVRRNAIAHVVSRISATVALTFIGITSVMPAFARHLTASAPLVGLVGTIYYAGLLLPQALVARAIAGWPRKKPFASATLVGRLALFVVAAALFAGTAATAPAQMLALFFVCLAVYALSAGAGMVGWYDIIGRAIPTRTRIRLDGLAQAVGATAGVGAGALIGWILSRPELAFPTNYALLFALAGLFLVPGSLALLALREPDPTAPPRAKAGNRDTLRRGTLGRVISDRRFRRVLACRLLIASMDLATPFYVIHAADVLGLPEAAIGSFTIAYTTAAVGASLLYGAIGGRKGPHAVIRVAGAAAIVSPLFALAAHLAGGGWVVVAYPVVFFALGMVTSAYIVGFGNYLLALAPDGLHGAYIGLGNTFLGIQALAPMVGGWLLASTSYTVLFSLSALGVALGFVLALRLPPAQPTMDPAR